MFFIYSNSIMYGSCFGSGVNDTGAGRAAVSREPLWYSIASMVLLLALIFAHKFLTAGQRSLADTGLELR
jgi:ABC-type Co2+ transport system permease subunit